jgi:hypothetical protein
MICSQRSSRGFKPSSEREGEIELGGLYLSLSPIESHHIPGAVALPAPQSVRPLPQSPVKQPVPVKAIGRRKEDPQQRRSRRLHNRKQAPKTAHARIRRSGWGPPASGWPMVLLTE